MDGITVVTQDGKDIFLSNTLVENIPLLNDMKKILGNSEDRVPLVVIHSRTMFDIVATLQSEQRSATTATFGLERIVEAANAANFLMCEELVDHYCQCMLDILDDMSWEEIQQTTI
jgi:hypothetical protein